MTAAIRIGTGKNKKNTTNCGKSIAHAASIPSIEPDAPTIMQWQGIGAFVFTHDTDATKFRVQRANGDRYTVSLFTISGEPDTKFAVLALPPNDFVASQLLDADGNILQRFDGF